MCYGRRENNLVFVVEVCILSLLATLIDISKPDGIVFFACSLQGGNEFWEDWGVLKIVIYCGNMTELGRQCARLYTKTHTRTPTHTCRQCTHTTAYVSRWMGSYVYHVAMEFVERPSSCCHSNQGTLLWLDGKMSVALFHRTDLLFVEDSVSRFILKSSACNRGQLRW